MKKKIITTLLALFAAIACIAGLVACDDGTASPVAGKTYVFEKVEITEGASGTAKDLAEAILAQMFVDSSIAFDEDGTTYTMTVMGIAESGTYTQDGNKLILTADEKAQEAKVSGNTVKLVFSEEGVSANIVYKKVKEDVGIITSPKVDVAGKTYVFDEAYGLNDTEVETAYDGATISFDENGGFTITMQGSPVSGSYTQTEAGITLNLNGTTMNATASGNELVLQLYAVELYFQLEGTEAPTNTLSGQTYILTEYKINGTLVTDEIDGAIYFYRNKYEMNVGDQTTGVYTVEGTTVTLIPASTLGDTITLKISGKNLTYTVKKANQIISMVYMLESEIEKTVFELLADKTYVLTECINEGNSMMDQMPETKLTFHEGGSYTMSSNGTDMTGTCSGGFNKGVYWVSLESEYGTLFTLDIADKTLTFNFMQETKMVYTLEE